MPNIAKLFPSYKQPGLLEQLNTPKTMGEQEMRIKDLEAEHQVEVADLLETVVTSVESFKEVLEKTDKLGPQDRVFINHYLTSISKQTGVRLPTLRLEGDDDQFRTITLEGIGDLLKFKGAGGKFLAAGLLAALAALIASVLKFLKGSSARRAESLAVIEKANVDKHLAAADLNIQAGKMMEEMIKSLPKRPESIKAATVVPKETAAAVTRATKDLPKPVEFQTIEIEGKTYYYTQDSDLFKDCLKEFTVKGDVLSWALWSEALVGKLLGTVKGGNYHLSTKDLQELIKALGDEVMSSTKVLPRVKVSINKSKEFIEKAQKEMIDAGRGKGDLKGVIERLKSEAKEIAALHEVTIKELIGDRRYVSGSALYTVERNEEGIYTPKEVEPKYAKGVSESGSMLISGVTRGEISNCSTELNKHRLDVNLAALEGEIKGMINGIEKFGTSHPVMKSLKGDDAETAVKFEHHLIETLINKPIKVYGTYTRGQSRFVGIVSSAVTEITIIFSQILSGFLKAKMAAAISSDVK